MMYQELWRTVDQDNRDEIDAAAVLGELEEVKIEYTILWCLTHSRQANASDHCPDWKQGTASCQLVIADVVLRKEE